MFAIVDTGPLVAFFDRSEQHHRWSTERIKELELPLLVVVAFATEYRKTARVPGSLSIVARFRAGRDRTRR
jgi:predicted nucleic acid-binding protein